MTKYQVKVDEQVIGQRISGREYTHAVVAQQISESRFNRETSQYEEIRFESPRPVVVSYHHSEALAGKALLSLAKTFRSYSRIFSSADVHPVEAVELKKRSRVRCTGLSIKISQQGTEWEYHRAVQCLKDAAPGLIPVRCREHQLTQNAVVEASARVFNAEQERARQIVWAANHAAKYTAETCPIINGCPVHHVTQEAN